MEGIVSGHLEDLDLERRTCKKLFLRSVERCEKGFEENVELALDSRFSKLQQTWFQLVEKHERYISLLETVDIERAIESADWIEESENAFDQMEKRYYKFKESGTKTEKTGTKMYYDGGQQSGYIELDRHRKLYKFEEHMFEYLSDYVRNLLSIESGKENPSTRVIKEAISDLNVQYLNCKEASANLLSFTEKEIQEEDMDAIKQMHQGFSAMKQTADEIIDRSISENDQINSMRGGSLKLERITLPRFNGSVREYPRFKNEFIKYVMPELPSNDKAAYVLKSCLCPSALSKVSSIDGDLDAMWERLDQVYGRLSKLVDVVMFEIKSVQPIKDGDNQTLLKFIDLVEKGYEDLKKMKAENEMSNATIVSLIEERLPKLIRREWSLTVIQENSKEVNQFSALLDFLIAQRRAIEYEIMDIRNNPKPPSSENIDIIVNTLNAKVYDMENEAKIKSHRHECCIYNTDAQDSELCGQFRNKTSIEKLRFLRTSGSCWCCLQRGHRHNECPKKVRCGVDGCNWYHHPLLHEAHASGACFNPPLLS